MDSPRRPPAVHPLELSLYRIQTPWGGWPDGVGDIRCLSGPPCESLVLNGELAGNRITDLVARYPYPLLGKGMELDAREPFPLRLRFLSTTRDLPVMIHPNDAYTLTRQLPTVGQEKIVYILQAKRGARLYCGMREKISGAQFANAISRGRERDLLHPIGVRPGQVYTLPSGRPYALGAGLALFEIGRHSDAAFRLGRSRPSTDPGDLWGILEKGPVRPEPVSGISTPAEESRVDYLCYTPRFSLRRFSVVEHLDLTLPGNRFRVYTSIQGTGWLHWGFSPSSYCPLQPYQAVLAPAVPEDISLESESGMVVLEVSMPDLAAGALREVAVPGVTLEDLISLGGPDYGSILREYVHR